MLLGGEAGNEKGHFILNSPGLDQSETWCEEERTYWGNGKG